MIEIRTAALRDRLAHFPRHFRLLADDGCVASFINGMTTDADDLTDEMYADAALHLVRLYSQRRCRSAVPAARTRHAVRVLQPPRIDWRSDCAVMQKSARSP